MAFGYSTKGNWLRKRDLMRMVKRNNPNVFNVIEKNNATCYVDPMNSLVILLNGKRYTYIIVNNFNLVQVGAWQW